MSGCLVDPDPNPGVPLKWPERLTPPLHDILSFMCFQLGQFAHAYRDVGEFVDGAGNQLQSRAEDEQAFMLHKFLGFWAEHGAAWKPAATADLDRVLAILKARAATAGEAK